ncbi:MAG: pyridoxamine 5'-phosphate oxidase family protein [Bacillota bacterium]
MDIPKYIKEIIKREKLCTMATCWKDEPYLSTMIFTYLDLENKIILSSKRDSKKFFNIKKNKNVSILIFSKDKELSITLVGNVEIVKKEKEKHYKKIHMNNSKRSQFIKGDSISLIIFKIEKITVSNNEDEVKYY